MLVALPMGTTYVVDQTCKSEQECVELLLRYRNGSVTRDRSGDAKPLLPLPHHNYLGFLGNDLVT